MAYTVDYNKTYGETKYMQEGEHKATIKLYMIKEMEDETVGKLEHINFLLENDQGEVQWDMLWQNYDEETMTLKYNVRKLNGYSKSVGIPEGTTFNTIIEWAEYIVGKQLVVVVEDVEGSDGVTRARARYVKPLSVEDTIPF